MEPTRQSKIARLPAHIREQVNVRLFDGQAGSEILPWLNGLPEVAQIIAAKYEGVAISDTNLSNWRTTGYMDWLKRRDQADSIRERAEYCLKVVEAGGDVLQGSAAIAGGMLMQVIEGLDPQLQSTLIAENPEKLVPLLGTLSSLMSARTAHERAQTAKDLAQTAKERTAIAKQNTEQSAERLTLDRRKFEFDVCDKLLDYGNRPDVQKILANQDEKRPVRMEQLRLAVFGDHEGEEAEV